MKCPACRRKTIMSEDTFCSGDDILCSGCNLRTTLCRCEPLKPLLQFSPAGVRVMQGAKAVCTAVSNSMAKRIARALNAHQTDDRGL